MRLLTTRACDDAAEFADLLRKHGHEAVNAALVRFEPVSPVPEFAAGEDVQAIVLTSRNGVRALAGARQQLEAIHHLPVYAVGRATAAAARAAGFSDIRVGPGDGAGLVDEIVANQSRASGPILHLAGSTIAFDVARALRQAGFKARHVALYDMVAARALPSEIVREFQAGRFDGVILMSPRIARIYARLVTRHDLCHDVRQTIHFCLSENVAKGLAGLAEIDLQVSREPNSQEVVALINHQAAQSG